MVKKNCPCMVFLSENLHVSFRYGTPRHADEP